MKEYIYAQAIQKREVQTRLAMSLVQLIEHLLKLYLMPDNSARNHWQGEIYGFIHTVEKLKCSNKYPSSQELFDWTYSKIQDLVTDKSWMTDAVNDICDQYGVEAVDTIDVIMKEFDEICIDYFEWLACNLSTKGRVTNRSVYMKLDSIV